MGNYRLSVVNSLTGVTRDYEVNCDCDAAAHRAALSLLEDFPIDIWEGERWVAVLDGRASMTCH